MSILVGPNEVNKMLVGDQEVFQVWQGSDLTWPENSFGWDVEGRLNQFTASGLTNAGWQQGRKGKDGDGLPETAQAYVTPQTTFCRLTGQDNVADSFFDGGQLYRNPSMYAQGVEYELNVRYSASNYATQPITLDVWTSEGIPYTGIISRDYGWVSLKFFGSSLESLQLGISMLGLSSNPDNVPITIDITSIQVQRAY